MPSSERTARKVGHVSRIGGCARAALSGLSAYGRREAGVRTGVPTAQGVQDPLGAAVAPATVTRRPRSAARIRPFVVRQARL